MAKTNEKININNTNYTDYEKNGDFKLEYVKINDVEEKLIDNSNKYPTSKGITYEMLQVLYEYKNEYNLNIPRYVDTFEEENSVDLDAVRKEIAEIEEEIAEVQAKMDEYIKELGL